MKQMQKVPKLNKVYIVFVIFAVLIALFYGNTLTNGFALDDYSQIEQNTYIQSLRYIPKAVTGCIWESTLGECEGRTIYYRPIQHISYIFAYQISSQAWMFHLMNLLHFFVLVSLVFLFVRHLFKNSLLAFFTAIIVLIHPVNSEVVNWPSAIGELQMLIFTLLSLLFYLLYRERKSTRYILLLSYNTPLPFQDPLPDGINPPDYYIRVKSHCTADSAFRFPRTPFLPLLLAPVRATRLLSIHEYIQIPDFFSAYCAKQILYLSTPYFAKTPLATTPLSAQYQ